PTKMGSSAQQQEIIFTVWSVGAEIDRRCARARNGEIGLVNITGAELAAEVNRVKERTLTAEPIVDQAGTAWGRGADSRVSRGSRGLGDRTRGGNSDRDGKQRPLMGKAPLAHDSRRRTPLVRMRARKPPRPLSHCSAPGPSAEFIQ